MALPTFPLVNKDFFILDINIPNTDNDAVLEKLNGFIGLYEKDCLERLLGYKLYKLFKTEDSSRMAELLSGAEYTIGDQLHNWKGLKFDTKFSLLAYYIFYFFQGSSTSHNTGVGIVTTKPEKSIPTPPDTKMVDSWCKFARLGRECISFLWNSTNVDGTKKFPEFDYVQYCQSWRFSAPINEFSI